MPSQPLWLYQGETVYRIFPPSSVREKTQSAGISCPALYKAVSSVSEQRCCLVSAGIAYLLLVSNHTARISTRQVRAVGPAHKLFELATQSGSDDAGGIGKMEPFF